MTETDQRPSLRRRASEWIESDPVQRFVIAVILLNAVVLGMQTSPALHASIGGVMDAVDTACLVVFVAELLIKLYAQGWRFFRDGWNIFDFLVVAIALAPGSGPLAVLRALRVLRVLRLVSAVPQLRFIVSTLLKALPGIASIGALLCIIFYVFAVMATNLFGASFPEWFGTIGASLYSLFQIMTLESWSMGIVRPVMEVFPWAWAFFVPFILLSSFTILNLFIAVIVDTMQNLQAEKAQEALEARDAQEAEAEQERGPEAERTATGPVHVPAAVAIVGPGTRPVPAEVIAELAALRAQLGELTRSVEASLQREPDARREG
ncbi:MAG: ion transporter [Pseudoclavibacter sp.]|nr:ion transporter [Pseudoclavibacter sp.]